MALSNAEACDSEVSVRYVEAVLAEHRAGRIRVAHDQRVPALTTKLIC